MDSAVNILSIDAILMQLHHESRAIRLRAVTAPKSFSSCEVLIALERLLLEAWDSTVGGASIHMVFMKRREPLAKRERSLQVSPGAETRKQVS